MFVNTRQSCGVTCGILTVPLCCVRVRCYVAPFRRCTLKRKETMKQIYITAVSVEHASPWCSPFCSPIITMQIETALSKNKNWIRTSNIRILNIRIAKSKFKKFQCLQILGLVAVKQDIYDIKSRLQRILISFSYD